MTDILDNIDNATSGDLVDRIVTENYDRIRKDCPFNMRFILQFANKKKIAIAKSKRSKVKIETIHLN